MVTLLHQRRLCEHDNSTASFTCFILKSETMPQETPPPSIERKAFVGTSWLALFRLVSQLFSWTVTILVACMLEPADYGLMEMAVKEGRATRPDLEIGICGEHGGDPESISLFYDAGLDYVSCSPFRVPIARLSAAQAVLAGNGGSTK